MPPAIEEHSVLCGRVVNIVKRRFDKPIRIPAVIIGGSHVECVATDRKRPVKCGWRFDVASVGYPGVVRCGRIACEPYDLGNGWNGFDFQAALARPVKVINDAAMQAPGGYDAETMLFLGLRMALGSALIVDGAITAMELKQLYCADGLAYEEYFGALERKRLGNQGWRRKVEEVAEGFRKALLPDDIVLGGGNAVHLKRLPPQTRRGDDTHAFLGDFRLRERHDAEADGAGA